MTNPSLCFGKVKSNGMEDEWRDKRMVDLGE